MPSKPVHIAQISDLHIKPPGSLAYGRVDTASALERCVAALNDFRPKPDLVVISGDLADTPAVEEYEYLGRLLAPLDGLTAGEQLAFWRALHETPRLTRAQRRLGAMMRGDS